MATPPSPGNPADLFDLTGRVAIVTGSTKGIGRSMVQGLAQAGATVVVSSRKQDLCDQVAREVTASTGSCSRVRTPGGTATRAVPVGYRFSRGEWCEANADPAPILRGDADVTEVATAYLYRSLSGMTEVASLLGRDSHALHY